MPLNASGRRILTISRIATMGLLATFLSACSTTLSEVPSGLQSTPDCADDSRIEALQKCKLRVDANKACNPLKIAIFAGDKYQIKVPSGQRWRDWTRPETTPLEGEAGNWLMNLFRSFRHLPNEPWMVLGMTSSTCVEKLNTRGSCSATRVRVASASTSMAGPKPLMVCFFANDVPRLNWNNRGAIWISVTRMPETDSLQ